jgi:hypothetical protein
MNSKKNKFLGKKNIGGVAPSPHAPKNKKKLLISYYL